MESSEDGDTAAGFLQKTFLFFVLLFASAPFLQPPPASPPQPPLRVLSTTAVVKPSPPRKAPPKKGPKKKKLYLTFDDGPNKGTKNVLDIVQDEAVPVSFFIVGEHVFASSKQGQVWDSLKMAQNIALCNHSFTHAHNRYDRFYADPEGVVDDFQKSHDSLGLDNAIVRTPGRNIWRIDTLQFTDLKKSAAAADSLQNAGFAVMGWDLEWHYDHKTMSLSHTAENLLAQIDSTFSKGKTRQKDHLVVLAHDQVYAKSSDSLQLRLLQQLKQRDDIELILVNRYPGLPTAVTGQASSQ